MGGCGQPSIFDRISPDDIVMAFFPCTYFETMDMLNSRCENSLMRHRNAVWKLHYTMKRDENRHRNYRLISTLAVIAFERNLRMVIENPYHSTCHYLSLYWPLRPTIIDKDRTVNGDYYYKPTQYWFINLEPKQNMFFEPIEHVETRRISKRKGKIDGTVMTHEKQVENSLIHPQYARRFIKSYLIDIQE